DGETALTISVINGNLDIMKYLIEKGANINHKTHDGSTVLLNSISNLHHSIDNLSMIKYLVENGADINHKNNKGETILNIAIKEKKIDIIKCLIENGADILEYIGDIDNNVYT